MPFFCKRKQIVSRGVGSEAMNDDRIWQQFLSPIWRGDEVSSETLKLKPDPFFVITSRKDVEVPPIWGGGMEPWYVDPEVKGILEELEPGRHGFISINVRRRNVDNASREFFILHVTNAIRDGLFVEKTMFSLGLGIIGVLGGQIDPQGPIVLRKGVVAGSHFWRGGLCPSSGPEPFFNDYFCSDEFAGRIRHLKTALISLHPCTAEGGKLHPE